MVKFNVHSAEWTYIYNHLHTVRKNTIDELIACDDHHMSSRLKGRIQLLDELLELPTYIAGENALIRSDE